METAQEVMEHIKSQYGKLFAPGAATHVADGWFWLVSGLCHALTQYSVSSRMHEPLKIRKLDQRLGTLCVHFSGGDMGSEKIIRVVQLMSNQVCQLCGATEDVGSTFGTQIRTVCDKCRKLDEQFHGCHFAPNYFGEAALLMIEAGLLVMPESWFKKHLELLL